MNNVLVHTGPGGSSVQLMELDTPACCEYPKQWTYSDGSPVDPPQVAANCVFQ